MSVHRSSLFNTIYDLNALEYKVYIGPFKNSTAAEKAGAYDFSLEGYKYGLSLTGTKTLGDLAYLIGDVSFTLSDIKFKDASGYEQKIDENMYEVRIITGYEAIMSPYVGIGYRNLHTDFSNIGGNKYETIFMYMPIGITYRFAVNKTARISTH